MSRERGEGDTHSPTHVHTHTCASHVPSTYAHIVSGMHKHLVRTQTPLFSIMPKPDQQERELATARGTQRDPTPGQSKCNKDTNTGEHVCVCV